MTALETFTKVLGYTKQSETDTLTIFTRQGDSGECRLGIGKNIGVGFLLNGEYNTISPFELATCANYMIEKGWIDLSKGIEFYMHE